MTNMPARRITLFIALGFLAVHLADALSSVLVARNVPAIEARGLVSGLVETNPRLAPDEARLSAYLADGLLVHAFAVVALALVAVPHHRWHRPAMGLPAACAAGFYTGLLFGAFLGLFATLSNLALVVFGTNPGHLLFNWLDSALSLEIDSRATKYWLFMALAAPPSALASWAVLRLWPLPMVAPPEPESAR